MAAHNLPLTNRADLPTIGGPGYSDPSYRDTVDRLHTSAARAHQAHANKVHAAGRGPNSDITTQSDGGDFPVTPAQ